MGLIRWCDRLITGGYFLLFALVPLLLTPWNYELFEYNKMMAVYGLTVIILASWVTKMLVQKEFRVRRTVLDVPIVLFVLSQLVSAAFSLDPHVSWFGYYSRFNGGMWSVFSYVILYYGFVSNFAPSETPTRTKNQKMNAKNSAMIPHDESKATTTKFLQASLITATLVAVYGVLEHMGIDKHVWIQDVQNRVFSTLGQPNWLAAYLVALTPLTWFFALNTQYTMTNNTQKRVRDIHWILSIVYWILSALFFLTLLYTRSRSGLLGLAVADVVFWGIVLLQRKFNKTTSYSLLTIHCLFALIIFINGTNIAQIDRYVTLDGWKAALSKQNTESSKQTTQKTTYTAPALESGGTESGTIRKYVWEAAIRAWRSSTKTMLIGTGTETFAFAFYQFRPVGHNQTSEWDFLYNKAHNEYLNYLATTGIFGLGSYLLMLLAFTIWFGKTQFTKRDLQPDNKNLQWSPDMGDWILTSALFAGWLSILITNFFGFSVVVTQVSLFLFPAAAISLSDKTEPAYLRIPLSVPAWISWFPILVALWLITTLSSMWYADKQFALGYQYDRAGLYGQAMPALLSALAINPNEPLYHDEISTAYAALATGSFTATKNATQAAQLAQSAMAESDKALEISPKNVNFLKSRTKVYYTLSALDPSFNTAAIHTLNQAAKLSPNDPKIYYNLAILLGREQQNDGAIKDLLQAKVLKPDYRDAYNALNIFYGEMGKKAEARAILEEYLTKINPDDADFKTRAAK